MSSYCSYYLGKKGPIKEICEKLVLLNPFRTPEIKPQTFLEWCANWITPGNVHLNLILHTLLLVCGFIIGFYRRPRISYAQYIYQKQYNEKEAIIIDELWQVLEDKFEIREQNREQKVICSKDLDSFESLEHQSEQLQKKIDGIKQEVKMKSLEVQQQRDKINKMIDNMTNMASGATNLSLKPNNTFNKLTQL